MAVSCVSEPARPCVAFLLLAEIAAAADAVAAVVAAISVWYSLKEQHLQPHQVLRHCVRAEAVPSTFLEEHC